MTNPDHKRIRHFNDIRDCHEFTFSCFQQRPLLTNDEWRSMLSLAIDRAMDRHRYRLAAFVYMPEHVHLLTYPTPGASPVSALLKAIKQPFSNRVRMLLEEQESRLLEDLTIQERPGKQAFRFWQEGGGYDRNLHSIPAVLVSIDYIHLNPVRRGLAERVADWKWSSAKFYGCPEQARSTDLPKITPLPAEFFQ